MKIANEMDSKRFWSPLIYGCVYGSDYTRNCEDLDLAKILATISIYGDDGFKYTITVDITDGEFPYKWKFVNDAGCNVIVDFDDNYNNDILNSMKKWYYYASALQSIKLYQPFEDGTSSTDGFNDLRLVNNYTSSYDVGKGIAKRGDNYASEIVARDREVGKTIRGKDGVALILPVIKKKDDTNLSVSKNRAVWLPMDEVNALINGEIKAVKRRSRIFKDGNTISFSLPFEWIPTESDIQGLKKALSIITFWGSGYNYAPYVGASGYYGCVFDGGHCSNGRRIPDYTIPHESGNSFDDIVKAYEDSYND